MAGTPGASVQHHRHSSRLFWGTYVLTGHTEASIILTDKTIEEGPTRVPSIWGGASTEVICPRSREVSMEHRNGPGEALGSRSGYVDAGSRCPPIMERDPERSSQNNSLYLEFPSFPSNSAMSVVNTSENTWNNPCFGSRWGRSKSSCCCKVWPCTSVELWALWVWKLQIST